MIYFLYALLGLLLWTCSNVFWFFVINRGDNISKNEPTYIWVFNIPLVFIVLAINLWEDNIKKIKKI